MNGTKNPPRVIFHGPGHVRAAMTAAQEAGTAIVLQSADSAAAYMGAPFFQEFISMAREEFPGVEVVGVLDCGADPGFALAAIREGIDRVRIDTAPDVRAAIADIAAQSGSAIDDGSEPVLDLLDEADPLAACKAWFAITW
jgi:hypothetical protein